MAAAVFDSVDLDSIQVTRLDILGDTSGSVKFECDINCVTETFSHYTSMVAKAGVGKDGCVTKTLLQSGKTSIQTIGGTSGTLVLNGVTYLNVYIENISAAEAEWSNLKVWHYTVSFVRDSSI